MLNDDRSIPDFNHRSHSNIKILVFFSAVLRPGYIDPSVRISSFGKPDPKIHHIIRDFATGWIRIPIAGPEHKVEFTCMVCIIRLPGQDICKFIQVRALVEIGHVSDNKPCCWSKIDICCAPLSIWCWTSSFELAEYLVRIWLAFSPKLSRINC